MAEELKIDREPKKNKNVIVTQSHGMSSTNFRNGYTAKKIIN